MTKLYKFTKLEHFKSLKQKGEIRIGTLHNFRKDEHGAMVSDSMEGKIILNGSVNFATAESVKNNPILKTAIGIEEGTAINGLLVENHTIVQSDCFVYCTAIEFTNLIHEQWYKARKYNVCYEIRFPTIFFRRISDELAKIIPVNHVWRDEVIYHNARKGIDPFTYTGHYQEIPYFALKDQVDFENQREFRSVWRPIIGARMLDPIDLTIPALSEHVKIHNLIK